MLAATDLSMLYGAQVLFQGVDLRLDRGHRYGIVGANGSGKSTLLRILAGQESPTSGTLNQSKSVRVGVLGQDHFQYEDTRILDVVMMGHRELWEAMEAKDAMLAGGEEAWDDDRYSALEDVVLRFDGYGLESRAATVLAGLGVPDEAHDRPLRTLSGGFKLRVLLAQDPRQPSPTCCFLDEPNNHLDIVAIPGVAGGLPQQRSPAASR